MGFGTQLGRRSGVIIQEFFAGGGELASRLPMGG